MDRESALQRALDVIGSDLAAQLDPTDYGPAADASVTIDQGGRLPGDPNWVPSFEPYWLAAELVDTVALRSHGGSVEQFTSEGSTFKLAAPNLGQLAAQLRAKSPLSALVGETSYIEVDNRGFNYVPRSGKWPYR